MHASIFDFHMDRSIASVRLIEIWQNQSYWPIKGWAAPVGGSITHFTSDIGVTIQSEQSLKSIPCTLGWQWTADWSIDTPSSFGDRDLEGWIYGPSFEKIAEMIKIRATSGIATATSVTRKRRWVRTMTCVSTEAKDAMYCRLETISAARNQIELVLREKQQTMNSIRDFESNRIVAHTQTFQCYSQATVLQLSKLKDHSLNLKKLKMYLIDRAGAEKEYSRHLENLSIKYQPHGNNHAGITMASVEASYNTPTKRHSFLKIDNSVNTLADVTGNAIDSAIDASVSNDQAAEKFFSKVADANKKISSRLQDFSQMLLTMLVEDVSSLYLEITSALQKHRLDFKHLCSSYHSSEESLRKNIAGCEGCLESVTGGAIFDIGKISEEINAAKGGVASTMQYTMEKPPPREDYWLSIYRYQHSVYEIKTHLDNLRKGCGVLGKVQSDLSFRYSVLFTATAKFFGNEQARVWLEAGESLRDIPVYIDGLSGEDNDCNKVAMPVIMELPPPPVIHIAQPPMPSLADIVPPSPSSGGSPGSNKSDAALAQLQLPSCPSVVLYDTVEVTSAEDFRNSTDAIIELDWFTVRVLVTSDGYLHVLKTRGMDLPVRTFHLRQCEVCIAVSTAGPMGNCIEIRPLPHSSTGLRGLLDVKIKPSDGIVIYTSDPDVAVLWLSKLNDPYSSSLTHMSMSEISSYFEPSPVDSSSLASNDAAQVNSEDDSHDNVTSNLDKDESLHQRVTSLSVDTSDLEESEPVQHTSTTATLLPFQTSTAAQDSVCSPVSEELQVNSTTTMSTLSSPLMISSSTMPLSSPAHARNNITDHQQFHQESSMISSSSDAQHCASLDNNSSTSSNNNNTNTSDSTSTSSTPKPVKGHSKSKTSWVKPDERPSDALSPGARSFADEMRADGISKATIGKLRESSFVIESPKPVQLIPDSDRDAPLSKRSSSKIAQYAQGLAHDKERASMKVHESQNKTLDDVKSRLVTPEPIVKRLSQRYGSFTTATHINQLAQASDEATATMRPSSASSSRSSHDTAATPEQQVLVPVLQTESHSLTGLCLSEDSDDCVLVAALTSSSSSPVQQDLVTLTAPATLTSASDEMNTP